MAAITITNDISDFQSVFDNPKDVFFNASPVSDPDLLATLEKQLPIIVSQATLNTGAPTVNETKLIDGRIWSSYATAGDADIKLQVASIAGSITDLFMNKVGDAISMTNTLGGKTYTGQGYNISPKKVKGALLYRSQDEEKLILLPNVDIYASFNAGSGTTAGYFDLIIKPKENADGVSIAFLSATA